ncbi:hypothetical protein PAHAL_4G221400 [Panicum hallii]|jgi:hypothetical protein|uniref:Uncharacterized protein n=1 Tax=Panicum hallii TaxID=206008 RepID=A0A2S3HK17_9POAL|nr:hypothetical protein PAHAL_4G221400 [Panicum hallii]
MEVAAAPSPHGGAKGSSSLAGLLAGAGFEVEDLERWHEDVREALSRIDAKRGRLQGQIAAASRGRRRAPRRAAAAAGVHGPPPLLPPADDDDDDGAFYARKGAAGSVRRRLRAVAGDAKKERQRLEALWGDLEEALADARERLALQPAGRTA